MKNVRLRTWNHKTLKRMWSNNEKKRKMVQKKRDWSNVLWRKVGEKRKNEEEIRVWKDDPNLKVNTNEEENLRTSTYCLRKVLKLYTLRRISKKDKSRGLNFKTDRISRSHTLAHQIGHYPKVFDMRIRPWHVGGDTKKRIW